MEFVIRIDPSDRLIALADRMLEAAAPARGAGLRVLTLTDENGGSPVKSATIPYTKTGVLEIDFAHGDAPDGTPSLTWSDPTLGTAEIGPDHKLRVRALKRTGTAELTYSDASLTDSVQVSFVHPVADGVSINVDTMTLEDNPSPPTDEGTGAPVAGADATAATVDAAVASQTAEPHPAEVEAVNQGPAAQPATDAAGNPTAAPIGAQ